LFVVFSPLSLWFVRREYRLRGKSTWFGSIVHVLRYGFHGMFCGMIAWGPYGVSPLGPLAWLGLLGLLPWSNAVTLVEEEPLTRAYGDSYREYCRRTPRYVGRPKGE
jgi:hypothetical protein